ncbi:MAG: ribose-5-phosphate isomerase RpiA [Phycisphaerales bacterium]|jgi:ribose 5-phosphate isomerase A|nr:ribose-5-phosphate isomerase RpiA [Phycisphaerales bacterium]
MNPKQRAAEAALEKVQSGMILGLGTGSTADYFLQALAAALKSGRLTNIRGVPTSRQSERRSLEMGIPLATLVECPNPDLTIDGADEIDPKLNLIKGLGGALLREKIVAQNSRRLLIIADASKSVPALGVKSPLPVEVAPFGHESHESFLRNLGATPTLRKAQDSLYTTDNGNYIYDCRFSRIDNPEQLQATLKTRAGIVETGLFIGLAHEAIIAGDEGLEHRTR